LRLKVNFKRGKANYLAGADLVWHHLVPLIGTSVTLTRVDTTPVTEVIALTPTGQLKTIPKDHSGAIIAPTMPLAPGHKLGPYEIVMPLGAGGMGEVYRARDTRLGREVAIKILPASLADDADRLRRFEQEARAVAALNHPNILAIHDIGKTDGTHYLVTELLEGESLQARLRIAPLPLRKALEIAIQAAHGVAAAHDKGVVHRDLKPANLFVTEDGRVKILDFGLAKLASKADVNQSDSLTLTQAGNAGTEPGLVLGTVGYMSPEQVRGKVADSRSDIFSLGAILYEMLSGKRAFQKDSSAEMMAAILNEEPPELAGEGKKIPPAVDRIVRHCLEKNPAERFQSARDLAFDLGTVSGSSTRTNVPPATIRALSRNWISAAAVLAAIVAAAFIGRLLNRSSIPAVAPNFTQLTFSRGLIYSARFAADGKTVYYAASWNGQPIQTYSTSPGSPESRAFDLIDSELFAVSTSQMAVSLGCNRVFVAACEGTLATVPTSGGAPREISESVMSADWASDGNEMAVIRHAEGEYRVEFPLGKSIYTSDHWLDFVRVSPNRNYVAFASYSTATGDIGRIVILDQKGKLAARSAEDFGSIEGVAWSPDGKEVWFGGTIQQSWANSIYAMTPSGNQRVVLRLPGVTRLYDVSRDGRVLLSKDTWRSEMEFRTANDATGRSLSWFDCSIVSSISSDGSKVAFFECGEAAAAAYLSYMRKTDGSPAVRLGDGYAPVFSPNGKWVLVRQLYPTRLELLPTGIGEVKQLNTRGIQDFSSLGWMPGGNAVYFAGDDGRSWRIYSQDLDKGEIRPLTPSIIVEIALAHGLVSPDGKYCFSRDPSGSGWLYPLAGGEAQAVKGLLPEDKWVGWSSDGRSAFVYQDKKTFALLFRLDPISGNRKPVGKAAPQDPAGLTGVNSVRITPDGKSYSFSYHRSLSDLFVVEGVH
jgi:serine/threonine protein kinase